MAAALSTTTPAATASIVDLAQDGRGVARVAGKTVFIDGALPGERVAFRVHKRRAQFDEATLLEILEPSAQRVAPKCAHFGLCGGCSLQHLDPVAQLQAKQSQLLEALLRIGGVAPGQVLAPLQGPVWGYRRRARLGVKYVRRKQRVLAGFRERLSPYLADLQACEVLLPALRDLPAALAALVETLELRERVPQVEVAVGDGPPALVFRVMAEPGEADIGRLRAFGQRLNADIYLQTGGLDTVRALQPPARPLDYAVSAAGMRIGFEPTDFVQVNAIVNSQMVDRAIEQLAPRSTDRVLDLFCGLGNFSLPLARHCAEVMAVEGDAGLIARARRNAKANGLGHTRFIAQDLFEPSTFGPWADEAYQRVLLDPPRAGAKEQVARLADQIALADQVSKRVTQALGDAGVLGRTNRQQVPHHMWQQQRVAGAMRAVDRASQRVFHGVHQCNRGIGKCQSRQEGRLSHPDPRGVVVRLADDRHKMPADQPDRAGL